MGCPLIRFLEPFDKAKALTVRQKPDVPEARGLKCGLRAAAAGLRGFS